MLKDYLDVKCNGKERIIKDGISGHPWLVLEKSELNEEDSLDYALFHYGRFLEKAMQKTAYYDKIINPHDRIYYNHLYRISLNPYDPNPDFVFANDETQALEILVGALVDCQEFGYIEKEIPDGFAKEDFVLIDCSQYVHDRSCGYFFYLDIGNLSIFEIKTIKK